MTRRGSTVNGFTIIEVFAVLLLIGTLVMLLLPAVQAAREMARRSSCANNFMQVALAIDGYHAAFGQLPTQLSGTDGSVVAGADNDRRLSIFVGLMPFLGNRSLHDRIAHPLERNWRDESLSMAYDDMGYYEGEMSATATKPKKAKEPWVAGGPEPFEKRYAPWTSELAVLRCPSDPGIGRPALARSNYAVCLGDSLIGAASGPMKEVNGTFIWDQQLAAEIEVSMRGVFVPRVVTRFSDISDGLSNTIMLGEMATGLGDRDRRTNPVAGPGAAVLSDNPNWVRTDTQLIDTARPVFWDLSAPGKKLQGNNGLRRGFRWSDGMPLFTGINTILPPNREIVMSGDCVDCSGILPPSSRHQGGVHVAFADGSVRFVTDNIESGDPNQPTVHLGSGHPPGSESPFGLWGALGTRASGELTANSFDSSPGWD